MLGTENCVGINCVLQYSKILFMNSNYKGRHREEGVLCIGLGFFTQLYSAMHADSSSPSNKVFFWLSHTFRI